MASISIALGLSFSPEHDLTIWTSFEGYQDTYDSGVEGKDSGVLKIWSEMIRVKKLTSMRKIAELIRHILDTWRSMTQVPLLRVINRRRQLV